MRAHQVNHRWLVQPELRFDCLERRPILPGHLDDAGHVGCIRRPMQDSFIHGVKITTIRICHGFVMWPD